jgi:hypothetical protein
MIIPTIIFNLLVPRQISSLKHRSRILRSGSTLVQELNQMIENFSTIDSTVRGQILHDFLKGKGKQDFLVNRTFLRNPKTLKAAIMLRAELIAMKAQIGSSTHQVNRKAVDALEKEIKLWLRVQFSKENLEMRNVVSKTKETILDQVLQAETVHPMKDVEELRSRFEAGRYCFTLAHHLLPDEPFAFIHIALTSKIAESMM